MAIPTLPARASIPPWNNVRPVQGTSVQLTTAATNTATSATQVTGLTNTFVIQPNTRHLFVHLTADSVSNSGANAVIISLWNGAVTSGTQVGQASATAASGALAPLQATFYIPITGALWNTSITLNIGMHGSGSGTNTIAAGATLPISFWTEAM